MSEELLNIAKELSEKPTTELAIQFMELTADNIIKEKEIDRLNNIINELEKYLIEMSDKSWDDNGAYDDILDKLKELKENNK